MSILKRTAFYDQTGGFVRMWDWALTMTTLGAMAEPFCINNRKSPDSDVIAFDPTDQIARVDELINMDIGKEKLVLSGGDHQLNGGTMMPRAGR